MNRYFSLGSADLVVPNMEAWQLLWDFQTLREIADSLPGNTSLQNKALTVANEIMNVSLKRDPDVGLDRISDEEHVTRTFRHAMHTRSPLRPTPTLPRSVL